MRSARLALRRALARALVSVLSRALAGAVLAALCGCTVVTITYGPPLPDDAALAAVHPGASRQADVVAALGAPEEYAAPNSWAYGRVSDPQRRRVAGERDLVGRRVLTWARETRSTRDFAVLPGIPVLADLLTFFRYATIDHRDARLVVLLDEDGVVQAVGRAEDGSP